MNNKIDFTLIKKYPNKYNLTPNDIKNLKILNWDKLKENTWRNYAMRDGCWHCHLTGCAQGYKVDNFSEFWIGFNEDNDTIKYRFLTYEGMCGYIFDNFYDKSEIENKYDLGVQVNAIIYLNELIDNGILGVPDR